MEIAPEVSRALAGANWVPGWAQFAHEDAPQGTLYVRRLVKARHNADAQRDGAECALVDASNEAALDVRLALEGTHHVHVRRTRAQKRPAPGGRVEYWLWSLLLIVPAQL